MADLVEPVCLTFVGCCANVFALEHVLQKAPDVGSLITLLQFLFVALQTLPSQLTFDRRHLPSSKSPVTQAQKLSSGEAVRLKPDEGRRRLWLPRLRTRQVPLRRWLVQVVLFFGVSWLNNYAFGFHIPVSLHIIFRSGGLAVSMATNYLLQGRRYRPSQVLAVVLITAGIVLSTLSAPPKGAPKTPSAKAADARTEALGGGFDWVYATGIAILTAALVLSALMGIWQEKTYRLHGDVWQEGLFYSHFLSLPLFAPLFPSLPSTLSALSAQSASTQLSILPLLPPSLALSSDAPSWLLRLVSALGVDLKLELPIKQIWTALALNVLTQSICVTGVNRLTSRVSSLTTTLILTLRKALSLFLSIWFYQAGQAGLGIWIGGLLVLVGTFIYSVGSSPPAPKHALEEGKKVR